MKCEPQDLSHPGVPGPDHLDSDDEEIEEADASEDEEMEEGGSNAQHTGGVRLELAGGIHDEGQGQESDYESGEDEESDDEVEAEGDAPRQHATAGTHADADYADQSSSSSRDGEDDDNGGAAGDEEVGSQARHGVPQQAPPPQQSAPQPKANANSYPPHWRVARDKQPSGKPPSKPAANPSDPSAHAPAASDQKAVRPRSIIEHRCHYCRQPGSHAELSRCCSVNAATLDLNCGKRAHLDCAAQNGQLGFTAAGIWFCGGGRTGHPLHTPVSYMQAINGSSEVEPCEMARRVVAHVYRRAKLPLETPDGKVYTAGEMVVARARGLVVDPRRPGCVTFAALLGASGQGTMAAGAPAAAAAPSQFPPSPPATGIAGSAAPGPAATAAAAARPPPAGGNAAGEATVAPLAPRPKKTRGNAQLAAQDAAAAADARAQAEARALRAAKRRSAEAEAAAAAAGTAADPGSTGEKAQTQQAAKRQRSASVKSEPAGMVEGAIGVQRDRSGEFAAPSKTGAGARSGPAADAGGEWRPVNLHAAGGAPPPPAAAGAASPTAPTPPQQPPASRGAAACAPAVSSPQDSGCRGTGGGGCAGAGPAGQQASDGAREAAALQQRVQELQAALDAAKQAHAAKEAEWERKCITLQVKLESSVEQHRFWQDEARRERERADRSVAEGAEARGRAAALQEQLGELLAMARP